MPLNSNLGDSETLSQNEKKRKIKIYLLGGKCLPYLSYIHFEILLPLNDVIVFEANYLFTV